MRLSRDTLLGVGAWNMYNNSSWKRKIWRSRKSTSSRNINDNSCWSVMYTKHYTNLSKGLEIAKDHTPDGTFRLVQRQTTDIGLSTIGRNRNENSCWSVIIIIIWPKGTMVGNPSQAVSLTDQCVTTGTVGLMKLW